MGTLTEREAIMHYLSRAGARGVSERVSALLGRAACDDLARTAEALGVDRYELGDIVERDTRAPSTEILTAIVRHYGVDPSWLVSGRYSASMHRMADERARGRPGLLDELVAFCLTLEWATEPARPEAPQVSGGECAW